jgi:hypothetical protein
MASATSGADARSTARTHDTEHDMTTMRGDESARDLLRPTPDVQTASEHWVACPEPGCHATAEVVDRYPLSSTDGPVSMVRTRCLGRHIRDWVDDTTA